MPESDDREPKTLCNCGKCGTAHVSIIVCGTAQATHCWRGTAHLTGVQMTRMLLVIIINSCWFRLTLMLMFQQSCSLSHIVELEYVDYELMMISSGRQVSIAHNSAGARYTARRAGACYNARRCMHWLQAMRFRSARVRQREIWRAVDGYTRQPYKCKCVKYGSRKWAWGTTRSLGMGKRNSTILWLVAEKTGCTYMPWNVIYNVSYFISHNWINEVCFCTLSIYHKYVHVAKLFLWIYFNCCLCKL